MRTRAFYLIAFITLTKGIIMNDEKYEKAKKRVEELKKFYGNLVTYIVINIMLVFYFTPQRYLFSRANFSVKPGKKKR
jgi:hypothetical protein